MTLIDDEFKYLQGLENSQKTVSGNQSLAPLKRLVHAGYVTEQSLRPVGAGTLYTITETGRRQLSSYKAAQ